MAQHIRLYSEYWSELATYSRRHLEQSLGAGGARDTPHAAPSESPSHQRGRDPKRWTDGRVPCPADLGTEYMQL